MERGIVHRVGALVLVVTALPRPLAWADIGWPFGPKLNARPCDLLGCSAASLKWAAVTGSD
jgi:hypothetical protein